MHYFLLVRELINRGLRVTAGLGSLWLISWAIRRKGEFDYRLDFTGQVVRWVLVVVLLGAMTYFPGLSAPRLILLAGGASFIAWPNFAYHLTRFLRWCRVLPPRPPTTPPPPRNDGPSIFPPRRRQPALFDLTNRGKSERR